MKNEEHTDTTDRQTRDLCGQEQEQAGARCMRHRGHDGKHECMSWRTGRWVEWER